MTHAQDVRRYQAYELVDMEGRAVLNAQAPGIPVVLASAYDAHEQAHREEVAELQGKLTALSIALKNLCDEADYQIHDKFPTPHRLQESIDDARRLLDGGV